MPVKCAKHGIIYEGKCYLCEAEKATHGATFTATVQPKPGTTRRIG